MVGCRRTTSRSTAPTCVLEQAQGGDRDAEDRRLLESLAQGHARPRRPARRASRGLRLFVNCQPDMSSKEFRRSRRSRGSPIRRRSCSMPGSIRFGREPRQFDAFYIGSKEAFSKPSAEALLHFSLGARVRNARATIGFTELMYATVGVSDDGRLQRTAASRRGGEAHVVVSAGDRSPAPIHTSHLAERQGSSGRRALAGDSLRERVGGVRRLGLEADSSCAR